MTNRIAFFCQFEQIGPGRIRCSACGTERTTPEEPSRYFRRCGVPAARPAVPPAVINVDCQHRGEIIERAVCNVCGMKGQPFDVFACELHGKCMVRRFRNDRPELAVCVNCDDFKAKEPYAGGAPMKTKLG